ncbi:unnamed protein product [Chironomus riparius]|uniref:Uncharacterized protein n=1 Tax=Chironomus riparius TaxID=315576 RepID=A0A9N9RHW2_9DIPT|nr:unnamed protein product [Chironomus riparius]
MLNRRYTFDGQPIYLLGEHASELHRQIEIQDFYTLRQQYVNSGNLFEDREFPAEDKSLFYSRPADRRYKWLRPSEICKNPSFFVEGYSRFDARQGELGDCWFLAAVASLTQDEKLFHRVVYDDNSLTENYAGIFHFCFWRFGKWVDVVIDDRLPTYKGQLVYMHSPKKDEFWSALLEKAYAKLHGSYEALRGGNTSEALEDFTGGVSERFHLGKAPANLYSIIEKRTKRNSMMACSIDPNPQVIEDKTAQGLVRGHAYAITKVQMIDIVTPNTSGKIPLLRLRNPWGNDIEWTGAWSDKSAEWRYIPDYAKKQIGLTFEHDGEFWMSFKDFLRNFDSLDICNLSPDSFEDDQEMKTPRKRQWNMNVYEGQWVPGITAGGCKNFLDTFHRNPQYVMKLEDPDEDDDIDKCTVIVSLMQKYRRMKRSIGLDFLTIGFEIYQVRETDLDQKPLKMNFFRNNRNVARTNEFINLRGVFGRFELSPGNYLIVPSTFEPNMEGEFLIRVFSESKNVFEENDETVRLGDVDRRVIGDLPDVKAPTAECLTIEKLFYDIAGTNLEIGWIELKQVLDQCIRKELMKEGRKVTFTSGYPLNSEAKEINSNEIIERPFQNFMKIIREIFCFGQKRTETHIPESGAVEGSNVQLSPSVTQSGIETGFSKDMCRSMVAMLDIDRSGKLGLEEFKTLLYEIAKWKAVFQLYDKDQNNKLDTNELRDALESAGYRLNYQILTSLLYRYGSPDNTMSIDDFIMCAVKVKTMIERFKEKDHHNRNTATFTVDEWIARALYS